MPTNLASRRPVSQTSWTITGASPETREKVKAAADAAGMSIRAWVDQTLNAAADGELVPRKGPAPVAVDPKTLSEIVTRLDDLQKRMPEDAKAAERTAAAATSAAMLKVIASGLQEMQRTAKDQARIAEGKVAKKNERSRFPASLQSRCQGAIPGVRRRHFGTLPQRSEARPKDGSRNFAAHIIRKSAPHFAPLTIVSATH